VGGHSRAINSWSRSREADSLGDVEDYAGEAFFVEVNFLVIGDLTDCAFTWLARLKLRLDLYMVALRGDRGKVYLTSAKVEGRSTMRAPPKRGVLLNVAMVEGGYQ